MIWRQAIVIFVIIFSAVIIELTLMSRLGLPGATPDIVVVSVVALALAMGPTQGATAGFLAGILLDLAPPADTLLGVNAIIYLAIGFVTGFIIDPRDRTVPVLIGIVGIAVASATLATAALDTLLGSGRVSWEEMPSMVLTSTIYAVIMAPVVVLGVAWIVRQVTPEASVING